MLEILRDIWERLFVREPLPESLAQVMDDAARKFPNDRVLVRWRAEFELERRQDLGLRKHDA